MFSGFSSVSSVPAGSLANASSVGANTVNGPAPLRVVHQVGGVERLCERLERAGRDRRVDDVLVSAAAAVVCDVAERQVPECHGSD